ncbi:MAG: peptidoglycan-binding domain-containing protein, partial [Minisyncoccia bacterium]
MSNLLKSKILLGVMIFAVMFVGVVALKATTASASDCSITTTLKFGMRSADVSCLQEKLSVSPMSGYFGNITKAAVMAFQASNSLTADGIFGPL